jgi:tripartite-type tricarboxylate transporter receptor subunit TctC
VVLANATAAALLTSNAHAESFHTITIKIVIGFSPVGATDILSRDLRGSLPMS